MEKKEKREGIAGTKEYSRKKRLVGPFGVSDEELEKLKRDLKSDERRSTRLKRELFLQVMRKTTNISIACAISGIGRSTFYKWLKKSKKFAQQFEEIMESKVDFAESVLFLAAGERQRWAILEILRSKWGRARGYGKVFELEGPGGGPIPIKLYEGIDDSKFPKSASESEENVEPYTDDREEEKVSK